MTIRILLACALVTACAHSQPSVSPSDRAVVQGELQAVSSPTAPPFSNVCRLEVDRSYSGGHTSSGFLVAPTVLGTAAHNVYSPFYNRVKSGALTCGRTGTTRAWSLENAFTGATTRTGSGYWWRRFSRDYASATLSGAPTFPVAFRLPRPGEGDSLVRVGAMVHVAGYPGVWPENDTLKHASASIVSVDRYNFRYAVDAERGLSGAPVWIERSAGDFVLVGVHVAGVANVASARRLDDAAVAMLKEASDRPRGESRGQ